MSSNSRSKFSSRIFRASKCKIILKRWTMSRYSLFWTLLKAKISKFLSKKEMSLKSIDSKSSVMPRCNMFNQGWTFKASLREFNSQCSRINRLEEIKCNKCCKDRLESCKLSMEFNKCLSRFLLRFRFCSNNHRTTRRWCISSSPKCTLCNKMLGRLIRLLKAVEIHPQVLTPVQVSEFLVPNIFVQMRMTMLRIMLRPKRGWWSLAKGEFKVARVWTTRQLISRKCGKTTCITNDLTSLMIFQVCLSFTSSLFIRHNLLFNKTFVNLIYCLYYFSADYTFLCLNRF